MIKYGDELLTELCIPKMSIGHIVTRQIQIKLKETTSVEAQYALVNLYEALTQLISTPKYEKKESKITDENALHWYKVQEGVRLFLLFVPYIIRPMTEFIRNNSDKIRDVANSKEATELVGDNQLTHFIVGTFSLEGLRKIFCNSTYATVSHYIVPLGTTIKTEEVDVISREQMYKKAMEDILTKGLRKEKEYVQFLYCVDEIGSIHLDFILGGMICERT